MKRIMHNINKKSKKLAKKFFIGTKIGAWLLASMAFLNAIEGIVHLVVAVIGSWGAIDVKIFDLRVWLPIIENFVLGVFSLLTGWALSTNSGGEDNHEHRHQ